MDLANAFAYSLERNSAYFTISKVPDKKEGLEERADGIDSVLIALRFF